MQIFLQLFLLLWLFSAIFLYIVFLAEVTDDLWGKDFGFGTHALRTKVFRI